MIERVARALCVADGMDPDHVPNEDGADGSWLQWMAYAKAARAAIEAMREPTEAMLAQIIPLPEHLIQEHGEGNRPLYVAATAADRLALRQRWSDLINAALE